MIFHILTTQAFFDGHRTDILVMVFRSVKNTWPPPAAHFWLKNTDLDDPAEDWETTMWSVDSKTWTLWYKHQ